MSQGVAPRRRALFVTLVMLSASTALISSLGAPLVTAVALEEQVPLVWAQWVQTAPLLVGAVISPAVGRLGGGARRRPVMLACLSLVALGCLLSALPLGFAGLVVGRVLQGLGIGVLPLAMATARDAASPERLSGLLAVLSVANLTFAGLGYPMTSLLATLWGVRGAFWFGLVLTLVALALTLCTLPASAHPDQRIDWMDGCMLAVGTLALMLAISQASHWGWTSPPFAILALSGGGLLSLWVVRSWGLPDPMVDLRQAVRRGVLSANLVALLVGASVYVLITLMVQLVQAPAESGGLHGSPLLAGLMMLPYAACGFAGNRVARQVAARWGPERVLPLGSVAYLCAILVFAIERGGWTQVALAMGIAGLGAGGTFAMIPVVVVRHVPPADTSSALSANQVVRFFGFAAGSALAATVLDAVSTGGTLTPQAFTVAALVGALLSLASALAALITLPGGPPGSSALPGTPKPSTGTT